MATITLHPIDHGFASDHHGPPHIYDLQPEHLAWLFRVEYRFCRAEGLSRRASRWHIHRMISMIHNPFGWEATWIGDSAPWYADEDALEEVRAELWADEQRGASK